jgi:hypothetical protein
MLRSFRHAPELYRPYPEEPLAGWASRPIAGFRSPLTALRIVSEALRESLAACREYEDLRSRGVPHDTALRQALGFGPSPSPATRATAKPLWFVGKV